MPRPPKQLLRRRPGSDSPRIREYLLTGHDWNFLDGPDPASVDLKAAWEELRDELLAEHIAEHPGTRPRAWWRFDAPGPRRQINPGPETFGPADFYGKPSKYRGVPPDDMFEAQRADLTRHKLIGTDERAALERLDAEDAQIDAMLRAGADPETISKKLGVDPARIDWRMKTGTNGPVP